MIQLLDTNDTSDYLEVTAFNSSISKLHDNIYSVYLEDHLMLEEPDYLEENIISNTGQYIQVNQEINLPLVIATSTSLKYKYGLLGLIAVPIAFRGYKLSQWIKNFLWNDEIPKIAHVATAESLQNELSIHNNLWDHDHDTKHFGGKKSSRAVAVENKMQAEKLHLCNIANNEYNIIIFLK